MPYTQYKLLPNIEFSECNLAQLIILSWFRPVFFIGIFLLVIYSCHVYLVSNNRLYLFYLWKSEMYDNYIRKLYHRISRNFTLSVQ